jgi:hypothetical protein
LKYSDLFNDIVPRWRVTPLPAYDASGDFIKTHNLEVALKGSLVLVYFELRHYAIKDKRSNGVAGNTFTAIATQVKVLERGADRRPSPYKSQLLKGPSVLPQSPSKKKDQIGAVNAFHPGDEPIFFKNIHFLKFILFRPLVAVASISNPVSAGLSTSDGKKRAIDEDGDATATEEDGPVPEKSSKKRKTQLK